ncbi:hypothetical protein [Hallella colorans]|nr:hypothetical protein [Hallella colorans]
MNLYILIAVFALLTIIMVWLAAKTWIDFYRRKHGRKNGRRRSSNEI